jgi:hypothetical protein
MKTTANKITTGFDRLAKAGALYVLFFGSVIGLGMVFNRHDTYGGLVEAPIATGMIALAVYVAARSIGWVLAGFFEA